MPKLTDESPRSAANARSAPPALPLRVLSQPGRFHGTGPAAIALSIALLPGPAAAAEDDLLLRSIVDEVERTMSVLSDADTPLYWMSVGVVDEHSLRISATHGASSPPDTQHRRFGDVDLRVGTPTLDNTHKIRDAGWFDGEDRFHLHLPLEDDPGLIRHSIWRVTDDTYRSAVRRLIKVKTNEAVKVEREDTSPDFTLTEPVVDIEPAQPIEVDPVPWTDLIRDASARFLDHPNVYDSNVTLVVESRTRYLVTTDGTRIRTPSTHARIAVWGSTVAEDGQVLEVYDHVDAASIDGMPDQAALETMVDAVARKVTALRSAPVVDPFTGPAILRGRAAAVFFHEILGHRAEGHRQKDEDEGQTLTDMVGDQIFPAFISVHDDPTVAAIGTTDLNGHYRYDDEGVEAERVTIIDRGILDSFLMSRAPIDGFDRSNGHGRRQPGNAVVARQGNLIVTADGGVPFSELRDQLIERVRAEDKPFGLIFDDISGGFTLTGRGTPNSYAVQPVTVWRVWPDGRPDELVRGVDLIGTPLVTFGRIVGASDTSDVFNGVCGAESGWVPVSGVSPDLLISEVEVQRREKDNDRPPLLPPPMPVLLPAKQGGGQ